MLIVSVDNVTKHFGPAPVLDGVTFEVRRGHRIGLVGPNGTGKTTLMRIISGDQEADGGTVDSPTSARIGYLEQHPTFSPETTVFKEAEAALAPLLHLAEESNRVAEALAAATDETQREELGEKFDYLQHQLHRFDGYNLNHRVERVLTGLGFTADQYEQPVVQLSGGQQNRLILAQLLLAEPDLMLLDEPSNHLDLEATQWLEGFLADYDGALIVVSHDRYFLDKVTNRTLELFHGTVEAYQGNFSAYWRQKAERLEVQRRTYENQQTEIAKMEDFVRRHHHGLKHAQAEDRRKKLERIERVTLPREIVGPPMGFPEAERSGDIVLRAERLTKGFGEPLFSNLSFDIQRGQRWGILGPNGCGKTTLLRCLLGEIPPDSGTATIGVGVKPGYFDQQLACLDVDIDVVDAIRPEGKEFTEPKRRGMLARFGLTGDQAFRKVGKLSGGERNRAALARLAASNANLLVLDEPTNHLDLWARDSLEHSLKKFDGTVLMITHDRYFLNQLADHLIVVENGRFRVIEGNYETYLSLIRSGLAGQSTESEEKTAAKPKPGKNERSTSRAKKRKFPYRKVPEIEADIHDRETRLQELHDLLTQPDVLRDGDRVKSIRGEIDDTQTAIEQLYEHWEEASEMNW
jgi:ATP-binding cassette subfamily F protein 3